MSTLADQLEKYLNVDVDTLDPAVAKAMPFIPHDATSNHLIVTSEMLKQDNSDMVKKIVQEHKCEGWEAILDYVVRISYIKSIVYSSPLIFLHFIPLRSTCVLININQDCRSWCQST